MKNFFKVLTINKPNGNGHIYPSEIVEKAFMTPCIKEVLKNGGIAIYSKPPPPLGDDSAQIVGVAKNPIYTEDSLYMECILVDTIPNNINIYMVGHGDVDINTVSNYVIDYLYIKEN